MTTPNPVQPVSHVHIAELVTRFALQRLDRRGSLDPLRIGEIIARLIEQSLQE